MLPELSQPCESTEVGAVPSEASEVFAWLMQIQNHLDKDTGVALNERGENLEEQWLELIRRGVATAVVEHVAARRFLPPLSVA